MEVNWFCPFCFLHGAQDYTCETIDSRLAETVRRDCADLNEVVVPCGHWMGPRATRRGQCRAGKWLAVKMPDAWPA